jgi:hypothetical protein
MSLVLQKKVEEFFWWPGKKMKHYKTNVEGSKKRKSSNSGESEKGHSESSYDSSKGKRILEYRGRQGSRDNVEDLALSPPRKAKHGLIRPPPGGYRRNDREDRRRANSGKDYREDGGEHMKSLRYSRSPEHRTRQWDYYGERSENFDDKRCIVQCYRRDGKNGKRGYGNRHHRNRSFDSPEYHISERMRPTPAASTLQNRR